MESVWESTDRFTVSSLTLLPSSQTDYTKMKFEGLTPHSSVGVQTKLMTCLIYQNKSVSKHHLEIPE